MAEERKLVKTYDKNGDGRLDATERKAAREGLAKDGTRRGGPGGPGGRGGRRGPPGFDGGAETPPTPGPKMAPADVKTYPDAAMYDTRVLRTFFLEFENADWEQELADFNNTDVEVPAKVTVDGKVLKDVGVHFRGMSSYMMVGAGRKRSLNLSLDDVHKDQSLGGYRTFNLLNSHEDPSFLRTVLYSLVAREYVPMPLANFVRVVINGEYWGVYVSVEQFNKDFVKARYGTTQGVRWKVPGSPQAQGGLGFLGDEIDPYRKHYEIKSKDTPAAWADLVRLCKVLDRTPADQLPAALEPILDVEGALRFLALENALINNDGYWVRSSDYSLYQDTKGRFHVLPHDANETFSMPGGPGFGGRGPGRGMGMGPGGGGRGGFREGPGVPGGPGGPAGGGLSLDPLVAASDPSKPLLSKLLAVPAYRTRYLALVGEIAEKWLNWEKLGPLAEELRAVIAEAVEADTRKLATTQAFRDSLKGGGAEKPATTETPAGEMRRGPGGPREAVALETFARQRRAYLLAHPAVQAARPKS
ncbi:MAG: CotH kinase family protein [Verrucomicrobiales bacterium]|nr:CotH kinase family protein [Verrucomicrobiales bacterium]